MNAIYEPQKVIIETKNKEGLVKLAEPPIIIKGQNKIFFNE